VAVISYLAIEANRPDVHAPAAVLTTTNLTRRLAMAESKITTKVRFYAKIAFIPYHSCWEWIGARHWKGYGRFCFEGVNALAHRVSWVLHKGPIPDGLHVLHRCDNPSCVRPEHLKLVSNQDNMDDRNRRGRTAHGEHLLRAKLTAAQVKEIRRRFHGGETNKSLLSREYNTSHTNIRSILDGLTWKHLPLKPID
jgi:hypothetical protein